MNSNPQSPVAVDKETSEIQRWLGRIPVPLKMKKKLGGGALAVKTRIDHHNFVAKGEQMYPENFHLPGVLHALLWWSERDAQGLLLRDFRTFESKYFREMFKPSESLLDKLRREERLCRDCDELKKYSFGTRS